MDVGAIEARTRGIRGRARELEWIGRLVDAADGSGSKVLVLTGQPGAGKSTLLDHAADVAAARGRRVLRVRGCEGEQGLDFAGVHQLLGPVLRDIDRLPTRQRDALRHAFGTADGDGEQIPEPFVMRSGVLTLLSEAATERPLLIVVDDAQWLDLCSLDVLAFVARRLEGERIALLLAARDESVPARFDRDFPHLATRPLDGAEAGLLLDDQPHPPRGKARAEIIEQAAGNPLALIELARAFAKGPGLQRPGAIDALPSPPGSSDCSQPTCPPFRRRPGTLCSWRQPPVPTGSPMSCTPSRAWRIPRSGGPPRKQDSYGSRTATSGCAIR